MLLVPLLLAATVAGLAVASIVSIDVGYGLVVFAVAVTIAFVNRRRLNLFLFFLCLAFLVLANLRYPGLLDVSEEVVAIDTLARRLIITAQVVDIRPVSGGRSRVNLLVTELFDKTEQLLLSRPLRVRLSVEEGSPDFLPGDHISFSGKLRQPRKFGTPGEFDWPRYLASRKIDMTSWVRSVEQIKIGDQRPQFPARNIVQFRTRVARAIDARLPEHRATLVRALVLGEGQQLPDDVRKLLAGAGVSHLFAISGLHLGMLGFFGYQLLLFFYRRSIWLLTWQPPQRILPLVVLPLLFGYLLLTGDAVSTRRAFALAGIGALLLWWRYAVHPLHLLAQIALISLLVNPLLLWQAGWQLSFCGAAGILLWRPLWQTAVARFALPKPARYLLQVFLVTTAATLATLPWVLFNFHLVAPAGLLANLICVPVVTLVALPLGFAGLVLFSVAPPAALIVFESCGFLLDQLVLFATWLTAVPGLQGYSVFLSRGQHLAVALAVLPLLMAPQLKRALLLQVIAICCLAAPVLWSLPWQRSAPVSLTMLSVGQGEALLLQNRAGQNMLIDGGGLFSQRFDVGERLLAPAFGELGVRQLDFMLLSHDHADHWKGLVYILEQFPVGELWLGRPLAGYHPALQAAAEKSRVSIRVVDPDWGAVEEWKEGKMSIFNGSHLAQNENDASLVVHLEKSLEQGLLLTGDLEFAGIQTLLRNGIPGAVTLLKLPHHGSNRSDTGRLIEQLQPGVALASVGHQNLYRLPARQVVDVLEQQGIMLFRTDRDGTLRAELTAAGWRVQRWQRGLFR